MVYSFPKENMPLIGYKLWAIYKSNLKIAPLKVNRKVSDDEGLFLKDPKGILKISKKAYLSNNYKA